LTGSGWVLKPIISTFCSCCMVVGLLYSTVKSYSKHFYMPS
jgi:hypothetical protein